MIKMPPSIVRVATFCLPLVLIASCGSGSEAVQGSIINFNPDGIGQKTTDATGAALVQELITIELRSPSGYAQIDTQLIIDTPGNLYLADTSTSPPTLTAVPSTYKTTTNSNGVVTVAIDFAVPARTSGAITAISAFSGTAYNRMNVTYTCTPVPPATTC